MKQRLAALLLFLPSLAQAGAPKERDWEAVEMTGTLTDFVFQKDYRSYYWAEDFTFLLKDDASGATWRVISREPTPAYEWRMGPTYLVRGEWKDRTRVKLVGVKAIDRIPVQFPGLKLNEKNIVTALLLWVEKKGDWHEVYVNNWFHVWGPRADRKVHSYYADKGPTHRIFGFARGQAAPFDAKSRAIIEKNKDNPSLMFQGRVKTAKGTDFGYEIELIDLIGRDVKTGGATLLYGDAKTIPRLESKR